MTATTVLVTGAAGRIAQAVCPGLTEAGMTVRGTDVAALPAGVPGVSTDLTGPAAGPVLQPEPDWYGDEVLALVGGEFATRG